MLKRGEAVFLQIAEDEDQRILHRGNLLAASEEKCSAVFEGSELAFSVQPEQEVLVYYESRKFMRRAVRVDTSSQVDYQHTAIGFEFTGEPVLAERRQDYRVTVETMRLCAKFGNETNCPIVDMSFHGIAVVASQKYKIGEVVGVTLNNDGRGFTGRMTVMSAFQSKLDVARYGLLCVDDEKTNGELINGLNKVFMPIQRRYLRRLAEAG